jgi:hypothetical protein
MMTATAEPLSRIFDGWDTYQQSLVPELGDLGGHLTMPPLAKDA